MKERILYFEAISFSWEILDICMIILKSPEAKKHLVM